MNFESAKRGFCPLPWIHLSANTDTSMRVCCNTDHGGHVRDDRGEITHLENVTTLKSAMNQATHKRLRSAMLKGERPEFCKRCYREEESGGVSLRQLYNRQHASALENAFENTAADGEIEPKVSYVDFSLTNNCNLKCRMCSPTASHLLKKEFDELGHEYFKPGTERARTGWNFDGNLGRIVREVVPNLTEMLTTGGEPFVSPQHLQILEACVEQGRAGAIVLRYHSNLTILPEKLISLWRQFKSIEIHVSLEGVGPMNEYVRYPSKWPAIMENLSKLAQLRSRLPVHVEIHTCLQAISWLSIHELLEWTYVQSEKFGGLFPRIPYPIWVDQPFPMTLDSLPPELRRLGSERILKVLDRNQKNFESGPNPGFEATSAASFRGAIQRLRELPYKEQDFRAFIARTHKVDRFRGHDLRLQVPEFKTHYDQIISSY